MAIIQSPTNSTWLQEVDSTAKASRVSIYPRGVSYAVHGITGTMAAALAANSAVFGMRLDPSSAVNAYIERIRVQWTTIVAFTAAVTAGRRLALYRGTGAGTSGGTTIAPISKLSSSTTSEFLAANGGIISIATTGALTVTGITFDTEALRGMTLAHVGGAGSHYEAIWEFAATESAPIVLTPGQVLALRNPVIMDAAGTWQLSVSVDWFEQTS